MWPVFTTWIIALRKLSKMISRSVDLAARFHVEIEKKLLFHIFWLENVFLWLDTGYRSAFKMKRHLMSSGESVEN